MYRKSATELHQLFVTNQLSAEEITSYFLKRIEKHDPQINAFTATLSERALAKARELDKKRAEGKPLGKLAGVPISIKDNIHISGEITSCASNFLRNYKAPFDATVVSLLEKEDAIILGKVNMDEFAMGSTTENSAFFKTKNPWNLKCTPGGSSGGSSACVAARLTPIALGTDTGGSIRQPASFTSTVGFKPTYGRVSRYGLVAFGSSLDQIGPITTTVEDTALVMEIIGKHCLHDSTSLNKAAVEYTKKLSPSLKGFKIGVPWHFLEDLAPVTKKGFLESIEKLKSLGAEVVDVDLDVLKYSIAVYYIIATAEASTNLARFDGIRYGLRSNRAKTLEEIYKFSKQEGFGTEVKNRILLGTYVLSSGFQDAFYRKAQKVRTLIVQKMKEAFKTCDLIAMPTSPLLPFELDSIHDPLQLYLQDIYTIAPNLAGLPAISVPAGFPEENKPLGMQLIGPAMEDAKVLSAAYAFEQINNYSQHIPSLFDDVR